MVICCWSAKGGQGTSVVACALALCAARGPATSVAGALLVDLAGDAPAVAGASPGPVSGAVGVADWLREGDGVPSDGLARLEVAVGGGLAIVPRGTGALAAPRAHALLSVLAADPRPVVVDAGVVTDADAANALIAAGASQSLLVLRPCFLAVRRAYEAPVRPSGVVLVVEQGRSLGARDVEEALGVPVRAEVQVTAQIARAVDAGMFARRLPRSLVWDLRHAA